MVDFQSRDTRRGLSDDDEGEDEAESTDDAASAAEGEEGDGSEQQTDENAGEPSENHGGGRGSHGDDREHGGHADTEHGDERNGHSHDHHHAHDLDALGVAVVTVSSSRTLSDDPAGDTITAVMEEGDDEVVTRELIPDEYDRIEGTLDNLVGRGDVDVVITTGGTGVTPDDVTIEAAKRLFDKELPGFGELFRLLSYDEIGTKVVATRATAGVIEGVPVFCLPGSESAVRLGTEAIISEQAAHIAGLARRGE